MIANIDNLAQRHGPLAYKIGDKIFTHHGPLKDLSGYDPFHRLLLSRQDRKIGASTMGVMVPEYCRLVDGAPEHMHSRELLRLLGAEMVGAGGAASTESHLGTIPVGYTYFGQFIAHELTLMRKKSRNNVENWRTPTFDLDSIFDTPSRAELLPCTRLDAIVPIGCAGPESADGPCHEDLPRRVEADSP